VAASRRQRGVIGALFLTVIVTAGFGGAPAAPGGAGEGQTVVVVPLEGFIDQGLLHSIQRRMKEAELLLPELVVFRIDTYGGLVDAAIEITDEIGGVEIARTVAFVPLKAFSAGAMISMGARDIVLTPASSIGDAAPVITTPEGPEMLGEKFQSPVRNLFRKYAQRNGYPAAIVEAMVTPEIEVLELTYEDGTKEYVRGADFERMDEAAKERVTAKRVIAREGELLTLTAQEAREYGIARYVVDDLSGLLASYELEGAEVVTIETNWSESLVRFLNNPIVSQVILLLGILGFYMEFKVPGFGLPGAVGIVCFAIFFFSKHLVGLAQYWEILLFVVGLILLAVELFVIPGFGVTGLAGIAFLVAGLVLSLIPSRITPAPLDMSFLVRTAAYFAVVIVAAFLLGAFLAWLLPDVPVVGRFFLGTPELESVAHKEGAGLTSGRGDLVGKVGRAHTPLRPAGRAVIGGEFYDVTTQGDMIDADTMIEVLEIRGNNIIVRRSR